MRSCRLRWLLLRRSPALSSGSCVLASLLISSPNQFLPAFSTHPDAITIPGLLIYRYDASLLFFNADYFKTRLLRLVKESKEQIHCVLLDFETSAILDVSGADALDEVRNYLVNRGIVLKLCRVRRLPLAVLDRAGLVKQIGESNLFPSIRSGVEAFLGESR